MFIYEGGEIIVEHVLQSMDEVVSNEYSTNHQALDIVSSSHTPSDVIALESGIVENVVKNIKGTNHNSRGNDTYGNYVKIKQNNGKSALYAHMQYGSVNANLGDYIQKGAIIGTVGDTGNAYGKHLHLEIKNENNVNENPITSLNEPKKIEQEEKNIVNESASSMQEINNQNNIKSEELNNNTPIPLNGGSSDTLFSDYSGGSIVDGLKSINVDSSYGFRKELAKMNGIQNYSGSFEQNVYLLRLLKKGHLKIS